MPLNKDVAAMNNKILAQQVNDEVEYLSADYYSPDDPNDDAHTFAFLCKENVWM